MTDKDTIKNSIDSIEPTDGAKERMLANIRSKAETESKLKVTKPLGRILPLAACLALVVGIAFFNADDTKPTPLSDDGAAKSVQSTEHIEYVSSPSILEERLGFELPLPTNAANSVCAIIDGDTALVAFDSSGSQFELRSSKNGKGISDLAGTEVARSDIGGAVLSTIKNGGGVYLMLTWEENGVTHCIISADCSPDDIKSLYFSLP